MFGVILEKIMKNNNIRVKDLAIAADITEGYISDLKKERSVPRENKLESILLGLKITDIEKEDLIKAWEKDVSPKSFVIKYEKLELENKNLKEMIKDKKLKELLEVKNNEIEKLRNEIENLKKYKEIFEMLKPDDLKTTLERIIKDIELEMYKNNSYKENKKDLEALRREIYEYFIK